MTMPPSLMNERGFSQYADDGAAGPTMLGLLSLLPPQFRETYKYFSAYPVQFAPLAASTTDTKQYTVDIQTDFIITYAMCATLNTTNDTVQAFPPVLVQITDSATTSTLFQAAMHGLNVYGDAVNPGIFAMPYVAARAVTITIQHQNQIATAINQYVTHSGFKSVVGSNLNDPRYNPFLNR